LPPYAICYRHTLFLQSCKADGTILLPSFHRYWSGFGSLDPANPNWFAPNAAPPNGVIPASVMVRPPDPTQKYRVLRPRPADQLLANEVWDVAKNAPYNWT